MPPPRLLRLPPPRLMLLRLPPPRLITPLPPPPPLATTLTRTKCSKPLLSEETPCGHLGSERKPQKSRLWAAFCLLRIQMRFIKVNLAFWIQANTARSDAMLDALLASNKK
jgi:hypothetical protein